MCIRVTLTCLCCYFKNPAVWFSTKIIKRTSPKPELAERFFLFFADVGYVSDSRGKTP